MTLCNMCGDCCKVIVTEKPLKHYRELARGLRPWVEYWASGGEDLPVECGEEWTRAKIEESYATASFVSLHWHRITKGEAYYRLPPMGLYPGYYFQCDQWDADTKLCKAGDARPPICSGFPWYHGKPGERGLHPAFRRCAYWADVKPELRPATILLVDIRRAG